MSVDIIHFVSKSRISRALVEQTVVPLRTVGRDPIIYLNASKITQGNRRRARVNVRVCVYLGGEGWKRD